VIWRRFEDVSPLTIGMYPFSADSRISVDYNIRTNEWSLVIQDVRPTDEGLYHCQVSTKDASEHMYNIQLNVKSEFIGFICDFNHDPWRKCSHKVLLNNTRGPK